MHIGLGETSIMSKMKPVFIAICVIFVVIVAGLVVYYNPIINDKDNQINALLFQASSLKAEENRLHATVNDLNTELDQKDNQTSILNSQINSLNDQITALITQIGVLNSSLASQDVKEPNLTIESLAVEDVRSATPYNLHFVCMVNNTGGTTAYNAFLHVTAFNQEGLAIDSFQNFGGITGHMSLGLNFKMNYTGSPIKSWSITPIWSDTIVTGSSGSFP
jgi:hypothetical protein